MEIRHIAAARDVPLVAIAAWKHDVEVWEAASCTKLAAFKTALEPGGRRLAISHDGTLVAAAAYRNHGVSVFDARSGRLIWARTDLQGFQDLTWSRDGLRIYCGLEEDVLHELDLTTGKTLDTLQGVRSRIDSPFGDPRSADSLVRDRATGLASVAAICPWNT